MEPKTEICALEMACKAVFVDNMPLPENSEMAAKNYTYYKKPSVFHFICSFTYIASIVSNVGPSHQQNGNNTNLFHLVIGIEINNKTL